MMKAIQAAAVDAYPINGCLSFMTRAGTDVKVFGGFHGGFR
jgi:hypothetical protein